MIYLIAPYRNRPRQLIQFISKYTNLLIGKEVKIIVIEQANNKLFNKGLLLNSGIKALNDKLMLDDNDILILNDIDCIIKSHKIDNFLRDPEEKVRHIYGFKKIFFNLFHCLGGIISMKFKTFKAIHGFPNNFWGWGAEDLALGWRTKFFKQELDISSLIVLGNKKDIEHYENPGKSIENKRINNMKNIKILVNEINIPSLISYNDFFSAQYKLINYIENSNYYHFYLDI